LEDILRVSKLSFSFGKYQVLNNVEFSLQSGEIVGLIGANGAGKTTLIKTILSLYKNFSGKIEINSKDYVGIVEEPGFNLAFSGIENLKYLLEPEEYVQAHEYIDLFNMSQFIKNPVRSYSQGMKQRLALAYVFSSKSNLALLDEPMNALDASGIYTLVDNQ
jgi:ABC-2 type transport system ATP-binding protein